MMKYPDYNKIIDRFYPVGDNDRLREILLTHSKGVAELAVECAERSDEQLDVEFVRIAAMLHDIGICRCDADGIECHGTLPYICHGKAGAEMLRSVAEDMGMTAEEMEPYARVCERHTGAGLTKEDIVSQNLPLPAMDLLPETAEEQLICYADKFYSKTRPEQRKTFERAERSLAKFGEKGLERFREWNRRFGGFILSLLVVLSCFLYSLPAVSQEFKQMPIPDEVWARMQGKSVPENCTVAREELRYLRLSHYDKEGKTQVGEMICNKRIAADVVSIFRELYKEKYVIERMQLIDDFDADDVRSMEANNTSCFCFRIMTGSKKALSRHAYGMAIDINPLYNPYVRGSVVSPPSGSRYAHKRSSRKDIPMKIDRSDLCYKLFTKHGFTWGGAWRSLQDYQHFEK